MTRLCTAVDDGVRCPCRASFNLPGQKPRFCIKHKSDAMVDVANKRCAHVDDDGTACAKQPLFNFLGEKGGLRCFAHKLDGMVNVVSKTCDHVDDGTACAKQPKFNFPGEKRGVRCGEHKVDGMIDVVTKLCEHGNRIGQCPECPLGDRLYKTMCTSCRVVGLDMKRRALGLCQGCSKEMNKLPPSTEKIFGDMIIEAMGHPPNLINRTLATGEACKTEKLDKRRPDLLWVNYETGAAVAIEIDEDSHSDRETSCELRKVSEQTLAIQKLEGLEQCSVLTIRINPDAYDGRHVTRLERARVAAEFAKKALSSKTERTGYHEVRFMYYHSKARRHISKYKKHWICNITI